MFLSFLQSEQSKRVCVFLLLIGAEDGLRFVFTQIDPEEWTREFSFSIHLDDSNRYLSKSLFSLLREPKSRGIRDPHID